MIPVVELRGIVKRFPGVVANHNADLVLENGEVHALLGENGAGKTTLMSILAGIYRPDAGTILLDGGPVSFRTPGHAIEAGIGMVHQHFRLVQPFTVAENVLLGAERRFAASRSSTDQRVSELGESYGLKVDPSARVWQLSAGEQQRVGILKALFREARILILDEPTAVLTPQEATRLFETLRKMAEEGRTVVFISHKLDEVMAVADRISVLRGGEKIASVTRSETDKRALARLMVGHDVSSKTQRADSSAAGVCLEVRGLDALGDRGLQVLHGIDLEVRRGEVLGVAGVSGNGQRELTEVIAGIRRPSAGTVEMEGVDLTDVSPAQRIRSGLAYVPEDRLGMGLVGSMDCVSNVMLKLSGDRRFTRGPFVNSGAAEKLTHRLVDAFDVKTPSINAPVRLMSGGNIQKLLLARELSSEPKLLVASQPTAGLDVAAAQAVHDIILEERAKGVGILLISEDLDELLSLSDRILVMYEGNVMGTIDGDDAGREKIGLMMAGTHTDMEAAS
ncbi:MAG: ABC transporter ATP-binding protein [Actinobacteria bacterium]|nr:ABC transporter ATP-binding protein [Actinomycetota bacterium]